MVRFETGSEQDSIWQDGRTRLYFTRQQVMVCEREMSTCFSTEVSGLSSTEFHMTSVTHPSSSESFFSTVFIALDNPDNHLKPLFSITTARLKFPRSVLEFHRLDGFSPERESKSEQKSEVNNFIAGNPIGELVWVLGSYLAAFQQRDPLNKRGRLQLSIRASPQLEFHKALSDVWEEWKKEECCGETAERRRGERRRGGG